MGSHGFSLPLQRLRPHPATLGDVRETVIGLVLQAWDGALGPFEEHAGNWINLGEDSLLTVGHPRDDEDAPIDALTFLFYDSVSWPMGLAEHWLRLALGDGRFGLEQRLRKLGYEVTGVPSFGEAFYRPRPRYLVHGGKIGFRSGDEVVWEIDEAGEYDIAPTPLSELDEGGRAKAEAMRAGARCGCPYCGYLDFYHARRADLTAAAGYAVEPVESWGAGDTGRLVGRVSCADGRRLLLVGDWNDTARALLEAPGMAGPWATRAELIQPPVRAAIWAYDARDGALVVWTGTHGTSHDRLEVAPDGFRVSHDLGRTWAARAAKGLPEGEVPVFFPVWEAGPQVFVRAGGELHASSDAGRTWHALGRFPAGTPRQTVSLPGGDMMLAIVRGKDRDKLLRSANGGKTWKAVAMPEHTALHRLVVGQGAVGCAASASRRAEGLPPGAAMLRSTDGGETWSAARAGLGEAGSFGSAAAAPDGRWYWSDDVDGLFVSEDEGLTWTPVSPTRAHTFFFDEDAVWLGYPATLTRLRAPAR